MRRRLDGALVAMACLLPLGDLSAAAPAGNAQTLKVALVQHGLEQTLEQNRDKMVRMTGEAAATGARLVIFPEGSLAAPRGTLQAETQAAVEALGRAARQNGVYVVVCNMFMPEGGTKYRNQLYVFSPEGENLLVYDKDHFAEKAGDPKLVSIDGVPCSFILCSDRWSRPVESLPPILGAKIIIECSGNFDTEWIPALQWYWYVPRAIRNTAYVIFSNSARENRFTDGVRGHGHSAVIAPDGTIIAAAADESDRIITADLDMRNATRQMAIRRSEHPLFRSWWDMGKAIHGGKDYPMVDAPQLVSSNNSVKCGFSLMPCTSSIETNVRTIQNHIRQAASGRLDLVVFPELAVTGDREEDLTKADPRAIDVAIESIRRSTQEHKVTVVFGAPSLANGKRRNSAYAIGPDGSILTRYDQIVVGRPDLFEGGMSTKAMWFQVNGVWSIVTIGDDAIWNEMAELAALRGARLHCHLRHDRNTSPAEALLHDQIVATFASFRVLTVVANPLHLELRGHPDASFSLGSAVWDDLEAGDWCAVKVNAGRPWEKVFSAPRIVPGSANPLRQEGYWRKGSRYRCWIMAGVAAMDSEITVHEQRRTQSSVIIPP